MSRRFSTVVLVSLFAVTLPCAVNAQWTDPAVLWPATWPDPEYADISDDGLRLVALIPDSGADENSREVRVTEFTGGVWQTPVVLAENGVYTPPGGFQMLPQTTTPVMSGDGETIAYLGHTDPAAFSVYVSDRQGGVWNSPTALTTGLENHHYWLSLSADGDTLAVCDYPFFGTQHVYVLTRNQGVWGVPVKVSSDTGDLGGGRPSLSADGRRLVYVANARLVFTERSGSGWQAPQSLTQNNSSEFMVEDPQLSGDGQAAFYWLVELQDSGGTTIRVAKNLYVSRYDAGSWGAHEKVNGDPIVPSFVYDAPAAADAHATRFVYPRPIVEGETINAAHLEISELLGGIWVESRLVAQNTWGNANRWPKLTPYGLHLVFDGGQRMGAQQVIYDALWEMTTSAEPPSGPFIFADGFESAGVSMWSVSTQF